MPQLAARAADAASIPATMAFFFLGFMVSSLIPYQSAAVFQNSCFHIISSQLSKYNYVLSYVYPGKNRHCADPVAVFFYYASCFEYDLTGLFRTVTMNRRFNSGLWNEAIR